MLWKELMERMSEHTGVITSYQLLITAACTNTGGKMKGSHPRAADLCPFVHRPQLSQVTSFMQLEMLCDTNEYLKESELWTEWCIWVRCKCFDVRIGTLVKGCQIKKDI